MPMRKPAPFETGVMFWAGRDPGGTLKESPAATMKELTDMGLRCGQLGVAGDLDLSCVNEWRAAIEAADFTVYTVFAAYNGESYADVPTVRDTVGFVPVRYRAERERRTLDVSDFAQRLGVASVATHIGCVPHDSGSPDYIAVREMVRRVCDHAAKNGQTFALETGQESAESLLNFLIDVNRPNIGINFDPANMILYGTGDPIEALGVLGEHVLSVHCKDGDWPPKGQPDALGTERPLGEGAVGMERYLKQLRHIGYQGALAIEREAHNPAERIRDIASAIRLLERLK